MRNLAMKGRPRRLPPLNSIRSFEAAARHRSISRAADELLVTHGAVSRQVKILEDYLGVRLFERVSSGLALTTAGVELAAVLSPIFVKFQRAFDGFAAPTRKKYTCRLTTVPSIASQLLVPRLRAFQDDNPDISLQILTTIRVVDLERESVDLAIRYGTGEWPNVSSEPLGGGALLAVCAPAFVENLDPDDLCAILMNAPLIHTHTTSEWSAWLEMAGLTGIDAQSGLILQDFNVAIKAAVEAQGVCLLPRILIQAELATNALRPISNLELAINRQYFLVSRPQASENGYIRQVMDWIRKEIRSSRVMVADSGD